MMFKIQLVQQVNLKSEGFMVEHKKRQVQSSLEVYNFIFAASPTLDPLL